MSPFNRVRVHGLTLIAIGCLAGLALLSGHAIRAAEVDPAVLAAETKRIEVIKKVNPAVVAIFAADGQGGGSGVLISDDGYALTNYHVVGGAGPTMRCGLADGVLYHAVLVGLDRVGDVALIKLLPDKEGNKFPFVKMGNSDTVKAGDWSLALGNPFLLATDFTPTVTYGSISGVHRYQYPEASRGLLEYTDCIQIDTSINPGNSGGPLFNLEGELIGINGRGSFEKRGRVNSGVGYAISINQIKNFLGHLRAGLDADHASLGATVKEQPAEGASSQLLVDRILVNSDAHRRKLTLDDELVSFAGRPMTSVNQYKNVLGLFPKGWRVPLVYRRQADKEGKVEITKQEVLVRLMGVQRMDITDPRRPKPPEQPPGPTPKAVRPRGVPNSPAAKLYQARPGFANYYFNKMERDRLLAGFRKHGDFASLTGPWIMDMEGEVRQRKAVPAQLVIAEEKDKDGKNLGTIVKFVVDGVDYKVDPLKSDQDINTLKDPPDSGGLMIAFYHLRLLLTVGEKAFEGGFSHGGQEPFYPPPAEGQKNPDYTKLRVDADVLRTEHAGVAGKWYFSPRDQTLLGCEISVDRADDPCEIYLSDYRKVDGRLLPHRIEVIYGNERYAVLNVKPAKGYRFSPAK